MLLVLVALMPFHAFLSVWLGHLLGHETIIQSWKEILIVLLGLGVSWQSIQHRRWPAVWSWPNRLIAALITVVIIVSALHWPGATSFWFGLKTDFEFLAVFILAQALADQRLLNRLTTIVIITSAAVITFGLAQVYFLPRDFLVHFGYGPNTIAPFLNVDPAVGGIRILATLGGPNQLGSFLILPLVLVFALVLKKPKLWHGLFLLGATIVLIHTYSRSAWIGTAAAIAVTGFSYLWSSRHRGLAVISVATLAIAAAAITLIMFNNPTLRFYLFHGRLISSGLFGSDAGRITAQTAGLARLQAQPLGTGLGTAGAASLKTPHPFVTENWYLGLGIELGLAGLAVFVALIATLAWKLWQILRHLRSEAAATLGALIGLSLASLFLHVWADSSTAIIFWAYAGCLITITRDVTK